MVTSSPTTARPAILADGQILDERYRILSLLADGGMGTVFLAEHVLIKRRLAVKVLHRELAHDTAMVQRFMNEALAAGTLGHPNIVEATDMGFTPERVPYIVYEYLEGSLLTEEVYRVGGLSVRRSLRIALQVASALDAAHNAGIVHLDLKSDNVFLTARMRARPPEVLDFGISRFMEPDRDTTQRGVVIGTPEFMAPEQVESPDTVDHRADVYALGVLLYEMLGSRRPFAGDDPRILLYRICNEPPPRLTRGDMKPELEHLLYDRLLAKDREARFASMKEVSSALEELLQSVRSSDSLTALATHSPVTTAVRRLPPAPRSNPAGLLLGVVGVLALVAGGALLYAGTQTASSTTEATHAALEADAEQISTLLTSQIRSVRTRADALAATPVLRAAIETDATTIADLVDDGALFKPGAGEVLELFLLREGRHISALRMPATAPSLAPRARTGIESRADGLWAVASTQVAQRSGVTGGTLTIASPIDLASIKRRIAQDALDARLVGLGPPVQLVTSPDTAAGTSIVLPVTSAGVGAAALSLHATVRPVTRGKTFRLASYGCLGGGALLVLVSLVTRLSRRRR